MANGIAGITGVHKVSEHFSFGSFKDRPSVPSSDKDRYWAPDRPSISMPVPDGKGGLRWVERGRLADHRGR